jgi:hypothetical protein
MRPRGDDAGERERGHCRDDFEGEEVVTLHDDAYPDAGMPAGMPALRGSI